MRPVTDVKTIGQRGSKVTRGMAALGRQMLFLLERELTDRILLLQGWLHEFPVELQKSAQHLESLGQCRDLGLRVVLLRKETMEPQWQAQPL